MISNCDLPTGVTETNLGLPVFGSSTSTINGTTFVTGHRHGPDRGLDRVELGL